MPAESTNAEKQSYGEILRSSALIGGSTVLEITFRIIRTKAFAVLVGPLGIGLVAVYNSVTDLVSGLTGRSLNSSGVRQIADAANSGPLEEVSRRIVAFNRLVVTLGAIGALGLFLLRHQISELSFGQDKYSDHIALLSPVILLGGLYFGNLALLQGMRRIGDLARVKILGTATGAILGVPIVYFYGLEGLVPSVICASATATLSSWWYSRKIKLPKVSVTLADTWKSARAFLKLGLVFMATDLITMVVIYAVRILVVRQLGETAAGYYQAAFALGGLYVGFILDAMGSDFYPRLTAYAGKPAATNKLVNEQIEIGLLLGGPGVLATLTFAPILIGIFYSDTFAPAIDILRWIALGMLLRVASWPIGYVLRAQGAPGSFFLSEVLKNVAHFVLAWFCLSHFGLVGVGGAFFGVYLFYFVLVFSMVRRRHAFQWTPANLAWGILYGFLATVLFLAEKLVPETVLLVGGTATTVIVGLISLRRIHAIAAFDWLPSSLRRLLAFLRLIPSIPPGGTTADTGSPSRVERQRMRVAFVPTWPANPYHHELQRSLNAAGVEIWCPESLKVLYQGIRSRSATLDVLHLHALPYFHWSLKGVCQYFMFYWRLTRLSIRGVPIVWTVHEIDNHDSNNRLIESCAAYFVAYCADALIAHGPTAKQIILSRWRVSPDHIFVVPHGHYITSYPNSMNRDAARARLGLPPAAFVFLFLGQIRPYKGVLEMVKTFRTLKTPEIRLVVAGRPLHQNIQDEIAEAITGDDRIHFFPRYVDPEEIQVFMHACDIVVLPYRRILTSGAAVLAMSFGNACIAPKAGCVADMLDDSGALLFDPNSDSGLCSVFQQALDNRQNITTMGQYNLEKAASWQWNDIGRETAMVYRRCVVGRLSRSSSRQAEVVPVPIIAPFETDHESCT